MLALDVTSDAKAPSAITLATPSDTEETPSISFKDLLKGAGLKDGLVEKDNTQNGIVLALKDGEDSSKKQDFSQLLKGKDDKKSKADLLSLLSNDTSLDEDLNDTSLNALLSQNLSEKDMKALIKDAKDYLKNQIKKTDGYIQSQVKEMPQTLKGLVDLAKKFDIDISKITIEDVQPQVKKPDILSKTKDTKDNSKIKNSDIDLDIEVDESSKLPKKQQNFDISDDLELSKKPTKKTTATKQSNEVTNDEMVANEVKKELKTKENSTIKSIPSNTPIFKSTQIKEVVTTEQIVGAKQFKAPEAKSAKERADETLKLLLRGEKPTQTQGANFTADFSVATAKVIAPKAQTDAQKNLESLLNGESKDKTEQPNLKTDGGSGVAKADSFEVKLNEAKQMIKYLSNDVKQAIDDYKSPFTRVKVQLNPKQLGEVDLTVVQRGKNLHINLSSNNAAINTLATNLNELKTQLNNSGINNATFNFNGGSSEQQQSNQQQQQRARDEYNYFDVDESNEEILNSLEIVVPSYA